MGCQNAKQNPNDQQAAAPPTNSQKVTGQAYPPPHEQSKLVANPPANQSEIPKSSIPPRNPGSTSLIVPAQQQNKKPTQLKEYQLKSSKILIKSDKSGLSEQYVSGSHLKGIEHDQFKGKKVRKFNISADIPEKNLIKESNYFDESNGDLQVRSKIPSRYADFSVGTFDQLNTFPVKTYLYDYSLNAKLTA